jgi:hypothetical protein
MHARNYSQKNREQSNVKITNIWPIRPEELGIIYPTADFG